MLKAISISFFILGIIVFAVAFYAVFKLSGDWNEREEEEIS